MKKFPEQEFYGTTTLGEKGQVVIPSDARTDMKMHKGEKLLVFGMGDDMVILSKLSNLKQFASQLAQKLDSVQKIIKKTNKK